MRLRSEARPEGIEEAASQTRHRSRVRLIEGRPDDAPKGALGTDGYLAVSGAGALATLAHSTLRNLCKSQLQLWYNVWRGGLRHWVGDEAVHAGGSGV